MDEFSAEQKAAMEELRKRVVHLNPDESALIRFIRARKFDVDAAQKQMEEAYKWRKEFGADNVLQMRDVPKTDLIKKLVPFLYHTHDKKGRPLYIERTGQVDVPRMLNLLSREELTLHHVIGQEYQLQRCRDNSAARGELVVDVCMIMDVKGLNMGHKKGMDFLKFLTELDNMAYPEMLGKLYVVNAPWMFNILWRVAKHWVDARTRSKIEILGHDYKLRLLEGIDEAELPVEYGGTNPAVVPGGGEADVALDEFDPELTEVDVPAGKTFEKQLRVDDPEGGSFSWFFRTVGKDIKFAAYFTADGAAESDKVVVEPLERFSSHEFRVEGTYSSHGPGTFLLVWDNTYSWTSSKKLRYNVGVTGTGDKD